LGFPRQHVERCAERPGGISARVTAQRLAQRLHGAAELQGDDAAIAASDAMMPAVESAL
jgi:hypothetical protein